jgi:hypothetical protein
MFLLYRSEECDIYVRGLSWVLYQRLVHYTWSSVLGHCTPHLGLAHPSKAWSLASFPRGRIIRPGYKISRPYIGACTSFLGRVLSHFFGFPDNPAKILNIWPKYPCMQEFFCSSHFYLLVSMCHVINNKSSATLNIWFLLVLLPNTQNNKGSGNVLSIGIIVKVTHTLWSCDSCNQRIELKKQMILVKTTSSCCTKY